MHVGVIGVNFKTSDLRLHEIVAKRALALLQRGTSFLPCPVVLLSTCNRTEIYFSADNLLLAHNTLLSFLKSEEEHVFSDAFYSYFHQECLHHLSKVASGLESAVFMETAIVRQIKVAYATAANIFSLPHALHYLFQKALKMAKSVRSLSPLRKEETLFQMLWQIALQEFPDIKQKKILLVGYSQTHRDFAYFLTQRQVLDLTFCTRQPEIVLDYKACDRDVLDRWNDFDLISCASNSGRFLVQGQGKKRHVVFDLSIPRNVDPLVESPEVKLFNMELLNHLIEKKKDLYDLEIERSHHYLLENIERLMVQYSNNKLRAGGHLKTQRG